MDFRHLGGFFATAFQNAMQGLKEHCDTELRTGVLRRLEVETSAHRTAGENLVDLLGLWQETVRAFTQNTLTLLQPQRER